MPLRVRNLYDPKSKAPYKVSRSKIELFVDCKRCFYIDRRLGIGRPSGPPFNLNKAVDALLKKEFDIHRAKGEPHPFMKAYGIDAIPFAHEELDNWRENFVGCQYHDEASGFLVTGAVDDLWVDKNGKLIVVDYKATSKDAEVTLDADWQMSYKRQMEIYQWILRKMGFEVSDTGYFVYCDGRADREAFDGKLEFDIKVIPYTGNGDWIDDTLVNMRKCLRASKVPKAADDCEFCAYVKDVSVNAP